MLALITGASSGIGREMAIYLSELGYDLIVVARHKNRLVELQNMLNTRVMVYEYDLSDINNCYKLYEKVCDKNINIIINNAGYGLFEKYNYDNLEDEINMVELNVKCLHLFTKLFVNNKNTKYILNVASSAGLMPGGPLMSTYYATKNYVCSYTLAIYEELRREKSKMGISILCPGPVNTNFNDRANVKFNLKSLSAKYVARYAIDKMFKGKLIIVPGISVKIGVFFSRFLPVKQLLKITYKIQERKNVRN